MQFKKFISSLHLIIILPMCAQAQSYNYIKECAIPYEVMLTIASVEKPDSYPAGYPYIISFNNIADYKKISQKKVFDKYKKNIINFHNNRNIDCKDKNTCARLLKDINNEGVVNLDLGGYQINQMYHKLKDKEYFSIPSSYKYACDFLYRIYQEKKVWSWQTVATYHSKTHKHNKKYQELLKKNYAMITSNPLQIEIND